MSDVSRNLRVSAELLVLTVMLGTLGFMVCGRDPWHAAYQTIVVLTTVGMEGPESDAERVWSIFLMVIGVGVVIYSTGNVVAYFVDGKVRAVLGRRQLNKKINDLSDHYIVIGFGRMGRALCVALRFRDAPFVLIENDDRRLQEADGLGYLYVRGDAIRDPVLRAAGIDKARGLASCLPRDADNVFVTLTARGLSDSLTIVARAEAVETEGKLMRAGATRVICPPVIGAGRVTDLMLNPAVEEMLELDGHWPDLELSKLSVEKFPGAVGQSVAQAVGLELIIVALIHADGTRKFNPTPITVLEEGDEIVVLGPSGSVGQLVRTLAGVRAA